MYRPVVRAAAAAPIARSVVRAQGGKRFASTASSKSGSWRGAAARWGLAGGLIYYYNASAVFAEEPQYARAPLDASHEPETFSTVESIAEQRRAQARAQLQQSASSSESSAPMSVAAPDAQSPAPGDAGALEEEASQQGAFNEETGEINWDCPCLGGMAYGPCGEQFRAAFSCFVYSKEEPKGVDCIEHFKTMQGCFREHPEVYGAELDDDEVPPPEGAEGQAVPAQPQAQSVSNEGSQGDAKGSAPSNTGDRARAATAQVKRDAGEAMSETDDVVPKAWHDSKESTTEK